MVWVNLQFFFDKYFKKDDKIVIACSTWPDSMFLLYEAIKTTYKDQIVACYFNHKLREESDEEEAFLEDLWTKLWFRVEIGYAYINEIKKLKPSVSIEELARKKRYDFLWVIKEIYNSPYIITAHHLDDKIETFLFNTLRWTKLTWAINMTEKQWLILRPLLNIEKNEILDYLHSNNLEYKIDSSNNENIYSRNIIRNEIIPLFPKINEKYKQNISNFWDYLYQVKYFIDYEINIFLNNSNSFKVSDFINKHEFLQNEIVRYIYQKTNNNSTIWLTQSNIKEIIRFIKTASWDSVKEIKNLKLYKKNNIISF